MEIGIALELTALLILQTCLITVFSKFEIETPIIKRLFKWLVIDALVVGLYFWIGHWTLLVFAILLIPGVVVHFTWCKRNGINPLTANPRRKLYELRGWKWLE